MCFFWSRVSWKSVQNNKDETMPQGKKKMAPVHVTCPMHLISTTHPIYWASLCFFPLRYFSSDFYFIFVFVYFYLFFFHLFLIFLGREHGLHYVFLLFAGNTTYRVFPISYCFIKLKDEEASTEKETGR